MRDTFDPDNPAHRYMGGQGTPLDLKVYGQVKRELRAEWKSPGEKGLTRRQFEAMLHDAAWCYSDHLVRQEREPQRPDELRATEAYDWWLRDRIESLELKGPIVPVLYALASFTDTDTFECWPGQERIAKAAGVGVRSVQYALDKAEELRLIERMKRGPNNTKYRLLVTPRPAPDAQQDPHDVRNKGTDDAHEVQACSAPHAQRPAPGAPYPPKNNPINKPTTAGRGQDGAIAELSAEAGDDPEWPRFERWVRGSDKYAAGTVNAKWLRSMWEGRKSKAVAEAERLIRRDPKSGKVVERFFQGQGWMRVG